MKIKVFLIISTLCLISNIHSVAQQTFYVYRNDGIINQYVIADINSIEIKTENGYVQEIHTADSISRIPLALIDSVSFSAPDPIKSISEAYVDIDWTKSELLSCDPVLGKYSLSYNETDPEIKEASVVVLENDTASYVVLVTDVNKNGNVYDIKGELGDVSYLFFDTEFTLTTEKDISSSSKKQRFFARSTEKKDVEFEDDGTMRATGTLWKNNGEEHTTDFYKSENTHAYTKSKFDLNLDYEMTLRFGDKEAVEAKGKKFFKAKNFYVDANIKGTMDAYYDLYIDIEKEETEIKLIPDGTDKYSLLKHNLFPTIPIKFMIGSVPVTIDLGADLYADVSLKTEGELHFTEGIGANATALIGARYDGQNDNSLEMYNEDPTLIITPHNPTLSGKGKISGKAHLFPRVHAWIYGFAGPSFDIKPYLRADLSGGFHQDLLQDAPSDYCAWSLETFCGLDLAVGVSRSRWNYEVWNKSTEDYNAYEYNLYKSPVGIRFLSATPDVLALGDVNTVEFGVYDKGFDGDTILTPLPQLVKIENKGVTNIKSTIGYEIASSGTVTASWTPDLPTDKLYASLYDINGNIIDEAQYFMDLCPDGNHPHMIDLGLPSGTKWACCNIGASTPNDQGERYRWGETEEEAPGYYEGVLKYYAFAQPVADDMRGREENGVKYNYIYIGDNICGTEYDVATVKWGNTWRMPSVAEMEELVSLCTWQESKSPSAYASYIVTGPNGASIFLRDVGSGSSGYWTGCLAEFNQYDHSNPYALWGKPIPHVHPHAHSPNDPDRTASATEAASAHCVRAVSNSNITTTRTAKSQPETPATSSKK